LLNGKTTCPLHGLYCAQFGKCGTADEYKRNSQIFYNFRSDCPQGCIVSKDAKCGKSNGFTSCQIPDQYCSQSGQCSTTDEDKSNAQKDYNFKQECHKKCNVS